MTVAPFAPLENVETSTLFETSMVEPVGVALFVGQKPPLCVFASLKILTSTGPTGEPNLPMVRMI